MTVDGAPTLWQTRRSQSAATALDTTLTERRYRVFVSLGSVAWQRFCLTGAGHSETLPPMADSSSFFQRWEPIFLSILRIVIGLLFLEHGTQKLFHFPPSDHPMPAGGGGLPPLMLMGAWLEFGGGLLLVLGLFTRLVGFILAGEMAVAYFMVHAPGSLFPIKNRGELAVALCFVFLYMAVAGGGSWSIDSLWRRGGTNNLERPSATK